MPPVALAPDAYAEMKANEQTRTKGKGRSMDSDSKRAMSWQCGVRFATNTTNFLDIQFVGSIIVARYLNSSICCSHGASKRQLSAGLSVGNESERYRSISSFRLMRSFALEDIVNASRLEISGGRRRLNFRK
jgi:hypothetical protein